MNLEKISSRIIEYSFYALFIIVPLILTPYNYELFEFNKMLTVYALTAIIIGSWLIKIIIRGKIDFKRTPFDIPILLFLVSQIISTLLSINTRTSIWGYYSRFHGGLISTLCYILLYYAYANNLINKSKPYLITLKSLHVILTTALIVSLYAILEHFGIDKHIWIQDVQNRVFSTLGQPNWLAAYLLVLIPISLALLLKAKSKKSITIYCLLITIFYSALLFTKSRSGFLGLTIAYLIFWILTLIKNKLKSFPWKKSLLITIYLLLITLLIGTPYTPSIKQFTAKHSFPKQNVFPNDLGAPTVATGGSSSVDIRKVVWQGAVDIWKNYPIFGSGVATFAYSYYNFRPVAHNLLSEWDFLYNKAHNEFLNFLATTGAFGLTSYCLIILWFTIWTIKNIKLNTKYQILNISLLAGFLGLAVSNFFGFSVVPVALFFFLWPALAVDLTQTPAKKHQQQKAYSPALSSNQYIFIILIIILTGYFIIQTINLWRADYFYNLGRNYVKSNQIPEGYQLLQKAVQISPAEPLFRSEYAEAAAKTAILYQQQIEQLPPDISPEQKQQAIQQLTQLQNKMTQEAINNSDIVISQNKIHLNYWKSRIKIFFYLANLNPQYQQQALEALQQAIILAPTDPKIYYNLSLLYSQMNQNDLAEQILIQAINLKPDYEAPRYALGSLYQQTNRPNLAKEQYQYILDHISLNNEKVKQKLQQLTP